MIDAMMGSGKTQAMYAEIRNNPDKSYMVVTPYLKTIQDAKNENLNIYEPEYKGGTKMDSLKYLLSHGYNICCTHSLFLDVDNEIWDLIHDGGYTLFIDEALDVVKPINDLIDDIGYQVKKGTATFLINQGVIHVDEFCRVTWCGKPTLEDYEYKYLEPLIRQKIAALNRLLEQGVLTLREYTELLRETQLDIYNEQKDAITEIIEKTMELVRQEAEDKIDALEEQIDDYQKIIDLKKESLEVARDEEDYEREVAERVAEIAKVQEKINQLSRDDSREANAERQQLEQELAELQNDLADYQADYAYDAQVDALDKEADKFEETKDNEIAKVEASVDTEEEVYRAAIDRINADWDQLYQDLIAWNRQYGDMIDGEDSITSAWQTAMQAAQEYGDIVSALNGINNDIANEQQGILDQQQEDAEISAIMSEMYANGQAWGSASDEEKQRLADENLRLGRLLAPYGINAVRGDDGVWYVDRVGGEQLFQKYRQYIYHDGGIVGEDSLKSNEVFAKLQKGEAVFTSKQYKNLFSQIGDTITGVVDSVVRSLATAKDTTASAIQSVTNNESTDNSMGEIRIENHFEVKNADEKSAKELAEYYSDRTIDKLMIAAKRKGMKNSIGSHMLR